MNMGMIEMKPLPETYIHSLVVYKLVFVGVYEFLHWTLHQVNSA